MNRVSQGPWSCRGFRQWWQQGRPRRRLVMEGFLTHSVPLGPCHALRAAQDRPRESSRPSEVPSALQSVPGALSSEQSLSFSFPDEDNSSFFHFWVQIVYHLTNAIVQNQGAGFGLDVLPTNGAFYFPLHPLIDTVGAETMGTVQGDSLNEVFWANNALELIL